MRGLLKNSFRLETKRIAAMAIIVALYVLFSWISKVANLSIFSVAPFLKIEFTDFICLLAVRIIGIVYSSLLVISVSWLRMAYLGDGPIDVFALMLADLIFIWIFLVGDFYFRQIINKFVKGKNEKGYDYLMTSIAIIFSIICTTFLMTFFNWLFIYDMYAKFMNYQPSDIAWFKSILVSIVIPFNLIKFSINGVIFMAIYRAIVLIEHQFKLNYQLIPAKPKTNDNSTLYLDYDLSEELFF
ncbi:ECF transporter S component [Spiroplasma sp. DGKH1]|uniref:ECF transporter S component n=1 Tax=Spiroplasma sp. DGKH1 TaxID=3050074 RepID=UPI0034C6A74C